MKGFLYLLLSAAALAAIALVIPFAAWVATPVRPIGALIIDKTVPDHSYREHKGLIYLLNHFKHFNRNNKYLPFDTAEDYIGFVPLKHDTFMVKYAPDEGGIYNLVYIADTYGVYTEEFFGEHPKGYFSKMLAGGLRHYDVEHIKQQLEEGATLIAEFNTFGSPTEYSPQKEITQILGLSWDGWIGRYFQDLRLGRGEIPAWMEDEYRIQTGVAWGFKGAGFVFVGPANRLLILLAGRDTHSPGVTIHLTENPLRRFDAVDGARYLYWFDVTRADSSTEVLAEFVFDLTESGLDSLETAGIPSRFPAITKSRHGKSDTYYFAGDFTDIKQIPTVWRYKWLDDLYKYLPPNPRDDLSPFFWKVYAPVMKRILADVAASAQSKAQ